MSRRRFINPLRHKKTRVARPAWMDGLNGTTNGAGSNGTLEPVPAHAVENHSTEAPVRRQPWLSTRQVFADDEQFREFMSILEENRKSRIFDQEVPEE